MSDREAREPGRTGERGRERGTEPCAHAKTDYISAINHVIFCAGPKRSFGLQDSGAHAFFLHLLTLTTTKALIYHMSDWPCAMRKSDPSSTAALELTVRSLAVHPGVVARTARPPNGWYSHLASPTRRTAVEQLIAFNHDLYVVTAVVF
jgi:hypothetical protein